MCEREETIRDKARQREKIRICSWVMCASCVSRAFVGGKRGRGGERERGKEGKGGRKKRREMLWVEDWKMRTRCEM